MLIGLSGDATRSMADVENSTSSMHSIIQGLDQAFHTIRESSEAIESGVAEKQPLHQFPGH